MKLHIVLTAFLGLAGITTGSPFTDCGSVNGQVSSVTVSNCPEGQTECALTRGTDADITIKFSSKEESKTLKAVVHGVIAGVPIPFRLPQSDACKTGVSCPLESGESYTYSNKLSIKNSYPPLAVRVRYELKDDNGADVICVEIPCKIH